MINYIPQKKMDKLLIDVSKSETYDFERMN